MGKSQPSVSRSLALLEQRVGAPLFEKGRRPLRPTELCTVLAQEGRSILTATRSAGEIATTYANGKRGVLRIAGSPIFMDGVVVPMLAQFQVENPGIRIEQSYAYADNAFRQMEIDTLDLAVIPLKPETVPAEFTFCDLIGGRNVIACGAVHPLAQRSSLSLTDIGNYPWIAPPPDSPLYQDLTNTLSGIGMHDFKVSFSGGSLASITNILSQTDALTVLPYSVVFAEKRRGQLHALNIKIEHPDRSLGIVRKAETNPRPSIMRFEKFMEREFKKLRNTMQRDMTNQVWRK
ncbi:MAG: LysR family transcriptional regulator [Pseudomonadota bacterium]